MNETNIIEVSEVEFNEKVIDESENKLVLVDFWAPWCGPCKQLTPTLEKIASKSIDKIILAKINIDENQQIATQLRIQSIPAVFAFKNKQIVDAFQGVLPEKDIIKFIEKAIGGKLEEDFAEFFNNVDVLIKKNDFDGAKEILIDFLSENSNDTMAISLYLSCLIETNKHMEANKFLDALSDDLKTDSKILNIIKRLKIIKINNQGPSIENLMEKYKKSPKDIKVIIELSNKYFSSNKYNDAFDILLNNYKLNKEITKKKMVEFFEVLGATHEITVLYRRKLSSIIFS